ncbi:hypothetical protein RJ639_030792 [Escallonia herrerae]|uniref:Subtilisin-like protease n=1 Tax=Escallonia herrerae TaxID=1293975 RepID=A0AA88X5S2_9ASTE|nr:hypothetical protein RJ639_030792 [Escallonia herrerae]
MPNAHHKLQTTRSWDYLGLPSDTPNNLLDKSIWPESRVFSDRGLGPIPSHWKGACESGDQFNATTHCNKKIIGARWFIDGYLAEAGQSFNISEHKEYLSARDAEGHGTHVCSIAAGSYVSNISYKGLSNGTVRGGAPRARLAMYKACWNIFAISCTSADIFKAFDEAIHDGVDVLSVSLRSPFPLLPEVDGLNPIAIGSFHAVAKGIIVACVAGNDGPLAQKVINTAPWILTVAASTTDRGFPTPITLGNNNTVLGQSMFTGKESGFTGLLYPEDQGLGRPLTSAGVCENLAFNRSLVAGKVVLCFTSIALIDRENISSAVKAAGGVGVIVAKFPIDHMDPCSNNFPCIEVNYEDGTEILRYILSTRSPIVKLNPAKTHVGKPYYGKVAYFSSRGPNSIAPAILKPDVAAPGSNIFAATSPLNPLAEHGFLMTSGTSFATPHVSGIVALLRALHPDWSPAAMKSALVTTGSTTLGLVTYDDCKYGLALAYVCANAYTYAAWNTDRYGLPVFAEGSPRKPANPFDFGGGIVNPNDAAHPGLVYDMNKADYINYLCAMGYTNSAISQLTENPTACPNKKPSLLDVNLPSITIPSLRNSSSLTRTVTNVGPVNSVYEVAIEPPFGTAVSVRPSVLVFNSSTMRISFEVTVLSTGQMNSEYYFGSLAWINGVLAVRSPISVRASA